MKGDAYGGAPAIPGFFFLFAEFAFLALTHAVDPAQWRELLKTFVKCQEIFIDVYAPAGGADDLDDYKNGNFRRDKQVERRRKKKLRKKYRPMSAGELERAARDNMKKALKKFF